MTPLDGVQSSRTEHRESSQAPLDPARAQDLYAVWSAIFENARPAGFEPSRPGQKLQSPGDARAEGVAFDGTQSANATGIDVRRVTTLDSLQRPGEHVTASMPIQRTSVPAEQAAAADARAPAPAPAANVAAAEVPTANVAAAEAPPANVGAAEAAADLAVHVQYIRTPSAQPASPLQPEALSIILAGASVSIVVRDAALTDADALRTAFEAARELTGRSASLQQLTLNGRVLYQQASADVAPSRDVLFAC
jgi:hypothetical protein